MSRADLLIELGCEELPAGSVQPLCDALAGRVAKLLAETGLGTSPHQAFATPRRLAVLIPGVATAEAERRETRRGPSVAAAYDAAGEPTRALQGFLRSAGASLDELTRVATPKGEWLALERSVSGRPLAHVLGERLESILRELPAPRRMRWGDGTHEFPRPVQWLLVLHGEAVLPLRALGLDAGRVTYGHRFHAPGRIELSSAASYVNRLREARVMVDPLERRSTIESDVQAAAAALGGRAQMDAALLDEVNALVEWPVALGGRFEARFLELPDEALVQTMQVNQRYFPVRGEAGELLPAFVTVANLESKTPQTVIDGNERVIRPRFADTLFFWEQDRARRLESRFEELERLGFQERLGSVADKVRRIERLLGREDSGLAPGVITTALDVDPADCVEAARLCKCDLASELVKELPEMQGIAGHAYARHDGVAAATAFAIESHYLPRQSGDVLPPDPIGRALAVADRLDTLTGIFALGAIPTGASDPFALRRAAIALVRLCVESRIDVDLTHLVEAALAAYRAELEPTARALLDGFEPATLVAWVLERQRGLALADGFSVDVLAAVMTVSGAHPLDIAIRLEAVQRFRDEAAATSLASATKRIRNILRHDATESTARLRRRLDLDGAADRLDASRLSEPAEIALHDALAKARTGAAAALAARDYGMVMADTARLREPLDRFFDTVMVMVEDDAVRENRLALLAALFRYCTSVADLGELQVQSVAA